MAKHGFNRDLALVSIDVICGLLLELFRTKRTTAKAHVLPIPAKTGGPIQRFFSQTGGAYDHIPCFLEKFPGIGHKKINAALATKRMIIPIMTINNGVVIADTQSNQRTATGATNQCFYIFFFHESDVRIHNNDDPTLPY